MVLQLDNLTVKITHGPLGAVESGNLATASLLDPWKAANAFGATAHRTPQPQLGNDILISTLPAPNVALETRSCALLSTKCRVFARDMPSETSRRPRESVSQSTDDASTRLTPSENNSDDGLSMLEDKDAYELQPISSPGSTPEDDALRDSDDDEDGPRYTSRALVQSYELYTPDEDRAVLKKLDRRLVGFMALLYCLSFLDRSSKLRPVGDMATHQIQSALLCMQVRS